VINNSKRTILAPLFIGGGVIVGLLVGLLIAPGKQPGEGISSVQRGDKISYTMSLIGSLYVDPISADSLAEVAIPVILEELDPHSIYIPARNLTAVSEPLEGAFDGIGVMFNMLTDTVMVLNVIPSGPSDKAGVQNGDRIIKINDSLVAGRKIPQDRIVKKLRGPRGTTVELGVERQGSPELIPITVTRGVIPLKSIDAAFMLTGDIGFVRLSAFSKNSHAELTKALTELRAEGMKSLVFDLRDNSGGFLDQAIEITNMFLPEGDLIVYTEDRNKQQIKEYADGRGAFTDIPLVVLINEGSASSSEILAGALQDNDRATIIGRRSFGKGLVQRELPYPDGSAIRLTIARYYTPAGRSIQKPYDHGSKEYREDIINRYYHDEMFVADSMRHDTLRYFTKGGRVVYGGGGIMPDVFMPLDTVGVTPYYQAVNGRNLIYKFTLDFGDRHREQLNGVATVAQLRTMLDGYPRLVDDFVAYASRGGVKPDYSQIAVSRPILEAQLRALIGRNTALDYTGFYAEIFPIDNVMQKAVEIFDDKEKTVK
jgi:carboxyl-terminal processing protease